MDELDKIGTELTNCDLCGADDSTVIFEGHDRRHDIPGLFRVVQCQNCDLIYLNPRPDPATLPLYYPEEYAPYSARLGVFGRLTAALRRQEAARTKRWLPAGSHILEVGCAAGDLLVPLRDHGFNVVGVELSPYASGIARDRYGLKVYTGTLADAPLDSGSFDAVVMRCVIPHFPSPSAEVQRAAKLLKPGGHLLVSVDNAASFERRVFGQDWYGFDVPRHLNLFTPRTLAVLLEQNGFVIKRLRYSIVPNYWIGSARYFLERRFGKNPGLALITLRNPFLLLAFLPVTCVQRLLRNSSRIVADAIKCSGGEDGWITGSSAKGPSST